MLLGGFVPHRDTTIQPCVTDESDAAESTRSVPGISTAASSASAAPSAAIEVPTDGDGVDHSAQQESLAGSLNREMAAIFKPSDIVG
jgi:hypothetical protein